MSSEHCLRYVFIPLHAKRWQDFTKLLLLILQSCLCSLLCVIYVLNHMFGHAHACELSVFYALCLWHTWMQLLCLHFAEALFMGLEAKVCPFYGLFFIDDDNRMFLLDALNYLKGWWLLAWSSPSNFKHTKSAAFAFFRWLADLFATLVIRPIGFLHQKQVSNFTVGHHSMWRYSILLLLIEINVIWSFHFKPSALYPDCLSACERMRSFL